MTNAELIATFRMEIKRQFNLSNEKRGQARRSKDYYNEVAYGAQMDVCNQLLSFLSDLEKSLSSKVTDDEMLENEIVNYSFDSSPNLSPSLMIRADFARHFYELGCRRTAEKYDEIEYERQRAEESEKSMNQVELQKEIEKYFPESTFNTGFNYDDMQEIASYFAKWGAEHLKK